MPGPDKSSLLAETEPAPQTDEQADGEQGDSDTELEALSASGDIASLLELAKAHRAGTTPVPKDLVRALECYRRAADLGSNEAEYAMAQFYATGASGVVPRDFKELARRLRIAANRGHVASKIYLGNLYELGIHYTQESEKADVWYRNAAREAGITSEPESPEWNVSVARLGGVRQCLALIEDEATSAADREMYLRKAKAFGYQLHLRQRETLTPTPAPIATPVPAEVTTEVPTAKPIVVAVAPKESAAKENKVDPEARARAFVRARYTRIALVSFSVATLFTGLGVGAGYLLLAGARELLEHRHEALPLVGFHPEPVMPAVVFLIGVLPALLVYRGSAWLRALGIGAIGAVFGYAVWAESSMKVLPVRWAQAQAGFLAFFLLTLFISGFLGGAKSSARRS